MIEYIVEMVESKGKLFVAWQERLSDAIREEIVRCRDCRFFRIGPNWDSCAFTDKYARADGFCAWGSRRDA